MRSVPEAARGQHQQACPRHRGSARSHQRDRERPAGHHPPATGQTLRASPQSSLGLGPRLIDDESGTVLASSWLPMEEPRRARRQGWWSRYSLSNSVVARGGRRAQPAPGPTPAPPIAGAYPSLGSVGGLRLRRCRRHAPQHRGLPAARRRARRAVPRDRRAPRRLPRDGQASRGRQRAAGVRGTRVPGLPDLRSAGARLRAPAMHRLRVGAARAVFLQGPGLLAELRRPAHDGGRRPSGRRGTAARARAPVGAESAVPPSLSPGLGSRVGARGARRRRARAPQLPAAAPAARARSGPCRSGHADPAQADPVVEESPVLAGLSSASIQGRIALGPRAGARVWRVGDDPDAPWVLSTALRHAHLAGFDLHANVAVPASDRARLEHCPSCQHENPEGAKFCNACGAKLESPARTVVM